MKIKKEIVDTLLHWFKEQYNFRYSPQEILLQETRKEFAGEITLVVFPFTKLTKLNPEQCGNLLGEFLKTQFKEIYSFNVVKGFLNLSLSHDYILKEFEDIRNSTLTPKPSNGNTIMVEYSSPNTNKPLHLGHVRNNLLGFSVSNILKHIGNKVIMANLINDRGIHICKSMIAWMEFGNNETPTSTSTKGDHFVGDYYVKFNNEFKKEVSDLIEGGETEEQAEKNAPILLKAQDLLRKWENNDEQTLATWKEMNSWVYDGFKDTYEKLGVSFDKFYYESQTYLLGKSIVEEGLSKGVFYKKDDNSVWVDLSDEGLDEKLLLRGDGTSVYITQDLGTAEQRFIEDQLDKLIYVVGNEQDYHFKVLALIFKKLGREWWNELYHLSYGMVELPTGKMKSREGTVVDADDLIAEMIESAKDKTLELGKTEGLKDEEKLELFRKIGLAALKFFILKVDPKKKMLFNPKESIDFQGFTGPFVLYTYARIQSILKRVEKLPQGFERNLEINNEEKELLLHLFKLEETLELAAKELSPAVVCQYVYDLAKIFNKFYHDHSILSIDNLEKKDFRILLAKTTSVYIAYCCNLLGIEVVEKM
jgi:arginyl-tRNA synthetase